MHTYMKMGKAHLKGPCIGNSQAIATSIPRMCLAASYDGHRRDQGEQQAKAYARGPASGEWND